MSERPHTPISTSKEATNQLFDLWAQSYDAQPNPLLALEERHIMPLLPSLHGGNVLDIGCGTGRWLCKLETLEPAQLSGADYSSAMLEIAASKTRSTTKLHHVNCSAFPSEDRSKSLVLASFVLSYFDDLKAFAQECSRVLQDGGYLFISDMHPTTAAKLGWKRSFQIHGAAVEITTQPWSYEEILSTLQQYRLELETFIEPTFDAPERPIFETTGRLSSFEELTGTPAIYIMKLRKRETFQSPQRLHSATHSLELAGAQIALGPNDWEQATVTIQDVKISSINSGARVGAPMLDLSDYLILPGLINAHDHLEFGLFPNLGRDTGAPPYQNSTEWAREIHQTHAATIALHKSVPKATRLWWGAIRNLLCGVTTVCHHNPWHAEFELPEFPVNVISKLGWSHSLQFDTQLQERFQSSSRELPFIIHAAEGIDLESQNEILHLDKLHVLGERTVLVHGLGLTQATTSLLNEQGTALVVCPTSNRFLFAQIHTRDLLNSVDRLSVGSDSPLTAAGDLLDEIRCLSMDIGLDSALVYRMVTQNSAKILHLPKGVGSLEESGPADLIAVFRQQGAPSSVLSSLTFDRIEMSIVRGQVQMASPTIYKQLPETMRFGMQQIEIDGHLRWIKAPLDAFFAAARNVQKDGTLILSGRKVRLV